MRCYTVFVDFGHSRGRLERPGEKHARRGRLTPGEAKRLSSSHTLAGGHRSFDLLHVAAAVHLTAGAFLSFDANQRTLAKATGLRVLP